MHMAARLSTLITSLISSSCIAVFLADKTMLFDKFINGYEK